MDVLSHKLAFLPELPACFAVFGVLSFPLLSVNLHIYFRVLECSVDCRQSVTCVTSYLNLASHVNAVLLHTAFLNAEKL